MDRKAFLRSSVRWHGPVEEPGIRNRTSFFILENGQQHLIKQADEFYDDAGNKKLDVKMVPLACGCVVEDPKDVVCVNGNRYCTKHVHVCPDCGQQIVPGAGEQVEQVWYHRPCAVPHRQHVTVKQVAEEGYLTARAETAWQQARLGAAQVEAAKVSTERARQDMRVQERHLELEEMREASQRELAEAQVQSVLEGTRINAARLVMDAVQADRRHELEARADERAGEAHKSQLESEAQRRRTEEVKLRLEWAERTEKLTEGTRRQLP